MKRKKLIWGIVLLAIVAIVIAALHRDREPSSPIDYQESKVTRGDLQVKILSTGVVQPENRLEIKPPIPGRVEEVLVEEGQSIRKGQKLAVMSSSERAALLDAARAKGPEELKRWEDFYQAAPILAPIHGTLILRNVEPGQTVTSADTLLVMSDRLTVKAQVDETDIAEIRLKQKAEIVLDAYRDATIPAQVDQIAYDAKTVNNVTTYIVDVLPDQTPSSMRSGMTANVTFFATSRSNVLRVSSNGIVAKEGRFYILTAPSKRGDPPMEKEIRLGLNDGKFAEVLGGLSDGDVVLIPQLKSESAAVSKTPANPFSPFAGRRPR